MKKIYNISSLDDIKMIVEPAEEIYDQIEGISKLPPQKQEDAYRKIIEISKSALAYNRLGRLYIDNKNYEKSISVFKDGIMYNPDSDVLHLNLGLSYQNLYVQKQDSKYLNNMVEEYEKAGEAKHYLGFYRLIMLYNTDFTYTVQIGKDNEKSISYCKKLIELEIDGFIVDNDALLSTFITIGMYYFRKNEKCLAAFYFEMGMRNVDMEKLNNSSLPKTLTDNYSFVSNMIVSSTDKTAVNYIGALGYDDYIALYNNALRKRIPGQT